MIQSTYRSIVLLSTGPTCQDTPLALQVEVPRCCLCHLRQEIAKDGQNLCNVRMPTTLFFGTIVPSREPFLGFPAGCGNIAADPGHTRIYLIRQLLGHAYLLYLSTYLV